MTKKIGRPAGNRRNRLCLRIDPELNEWLRWCAHEGSTTMSAILEVALYDLKAKMARTAQAESDRRKK